jgi:molybdopterin/thiamine biosynthesis adenylyltransferase
MNKRYERNRFYVPENEQEQVRNSRIFFGGAGIGSIIAECALRFGFESITVADGDTIEETNLNRQNYTHADVGLYKAETLARRLLEINPDANIRFHNRFIDEANVAEMLDGCDIAVNALDFTSDMPFVFDEVCRIKHIPSIHPFNVGWAGLVTAVMPEGQPIDTILNHSSKGFELQVVEHAAQYSGFRQAQKKWLEKLLADYKKEPDGLPIPQLPVASWIAAGLCVQIMYHLATGKEVRPFPGFYFSSALDDND